MGNRQETRVIASITAVLTTPGGSEVCLTRNVSRRGAFLRTSQPLRREAVVQVDLVHHGVHIAVGGRVTQVSPAGVGIKFTDIGAQAAAHLDALIAILMRDATAREQLSVVEVQLRHNLEWGWWEDFDVPGDWSTVASRTDTMTSLSVNGAAVECLHRPPVGECLAVRLRYPEDATCQVVVTRYTDDGFAVRFVSPPPAFQRAVYLMLSGAHYDEQGRSITTSAPPPVGPDVFFEPTPPTGLSILRVAAAAAGMIPSSVAPTGSAKDDDADELD